METVETTLLTLHLADWRLFEAFSFSPFFFLFPNLCFFVLAFPFLRVTSETPTYGCGALAHLHIVSLPHSHLDGLMHIPCVPGWMTDSDLQLRAVMAFSLIPLAPPNLPPRGFLEFVSELSL